MSRIDPTLGDDREQAFHLSQENDRLRAQLTGQIQATREVDDLRMGEIGALGARWNTMRRYLTRMLAECEPYRDSDAMDGRCHAFAAALAKMEELEG